VPPPPGRDAAYNIVAVPGASGQPYVPLSCVLYEMLGGRTAVYRE